MENVQLFLSKRMSPCLVDALLSLLSKPRNQRMFEGLLASSTQSVLIIPFLSSSSSSSSQSFDCGDGAEFPHRDPLQKPPDFAPFLPKLFRGAKSVREPSEVVECSGGQDSFALSLLLSLNSRHRRGWMADI